MKQFVIPDKQFVYNAMAIYLPDDRIRSAILENNEEFSAYHDEERMELVVNCENKPGALPIFGLTWLERE